MRLVDWVKVMFDRERYGGEGTGPTGEVASVKGRAGCESRGGQGSEKDGEEKREHVDGRSYLLVKDGVACFLDRELKLWSKKRKSVG